MGKNLMLMKKHYPEEYNFFPESYMLPDEYESFSRQFKFDMYDPNGNKIKNTFIIKPAHDC